MGGTTRGLELRVRTIRIGFKYQGKWCRETLKLDPTKPANIRYATRLRESVLRAIEIGNFDYAEFFPDSPRAETLSKQNACPKVADYLDTWLKRIKPLVKASTFRDYRNTVVRQLIPAFEQTRLNQITRPQVQEWVVGLNVSQKRAANILSPLRMALKDAVDEGLIEKSPLDGWQIRLPLKARTRETVDPFNADEQAAIARVFNEKFPGREQGRNLIQFAFWTGLRTSELVALEWGDIDWHGKQVAVSRALTQATRVPQFARCSEAFGRLGCRKFNTLE